MTRTEFVQSYAKESGLSDQWAALGIIDVGDNYKMIALPCGCDSESCSGWAMVSVEHVLHHLFFDAPDAIRDAYRNAVVEP